MPCINGCEECICGDGCNCGCPDDCNGCGSEGCYCDPPCNNGCPGCHCGDECTVCGCPDDCGGCGDGCSCTKYTDDQ